MMRLWYVWISQAHMNDKMVPACCTYLTHNISNGKTIEANRVIEDRLGHVDFLNCQFVFFFPPRYLEWEFLSIAPFPDHCLHVCPFLIKVLTH